MKVGFLDLAAPYRELKADLDAAYQRVMDSGRYLLGPETEGFETEFAAYCESGHAVAVASGCDALELALRALEIGAGDEVIVPSHTFIATWLAVAAAGATPVPVEPDPATFTLDPERVAEAITPRTRAILPVHLYGHPADLAPLQRIADEHGLAVVEDAAQAHGARYFGRRIGAGSTAAAFSFYPGKNLGAMSDGGAVVTADPALAERIRLLRNYGSKVKYQHEIQATNSRTDELQAAFLRVKLKHLDAWNTRRAAVAGRYRVGLSGVDGLVLPAVAPWAEHVWHLFVVRTEAREQLAERLAAAGVGTLSHYPVAVHQSKVYAGESWPALPLAEQFAREVLSLPIGPHLSTAEADYVIDVVRG